LSRTRARGVRDLKWFLDYAERGSAAIAAATLVDGGTETESPFEEAVYRVLTARGWTVHKQVGCARYRIDLAVVDPRASGRYLLGVECDGANYHRAKTARDRDKLREGVLRDLGWRLYRIWSTNWWVDEKSEVEKLLRAVGAAMDEGESPPLPTEPPGTRSESASEPKAPIASAPAPPDRPRAYVASRVPAGVGDRENFYEEGSNARIARLLRNVVREEEPILLDRLAARVSEAFGFLRTTPRLVERVLQLIPRDLHVERREGTFVWTSLEACQGYSTFRVPGRESASQREISEVAIQELANGMLSILEHNLSAPDEGLIRETARIFGVRRVGRLVDERLRHAVAFLVKAGRAQYSDGVITLL
jgi:very-short-patch-repair endonuclease